MRKHSAPSFPGSHPGWRQLTVNQERVANLHPSKRAGREERNGRGRAACRPLVRDVSAARFLELASNVLVANESADVLDRREVAEATRKDQLRAVVGQHVVSVLPVGLVELGLRLPHRDELDPRSSGSLGSSRSKSG